MISRRVLKTVPIGLLALTVLLSAFDSNCEGGTLVPYGIARQQGLRRAWFSQVRIDASRHRVKHTVLDGDRLIVLATSGALQMIDAHTGQTIWTQQVGNSRYPSLGPVASPTHIAVTNGSHVYVYDRETGREQLRQQTTDGIAAAPALSGDFVFVPQFSGRIDAFGILNPRPLPWFYASTGRIYEKAVSGRDSIVWTTDRGYLYAADPKATGVRFRFESALPIVAPPTTHSGKIFAASMGGYVYGLQENNGRQLWRYACGYPVTESPAALGKTVFVASDEPALHCLDAENGHVQWIASGVSQFISASEKRVYGLDSLGNLVVMDREHGVVRSRARTPGDHLAVLNEQTDRLYLVSSDGLVQCLHEIGQDEPFRHAPKSVSTEVGESPDADGTGPKTMEEPKAEEPADPFDNGGADPFGGGGDPFGGGGSGESPANDDPFGGSEPEGGDPFGGEPAEDPGGDPFGGQ